MNPKVRQFVAEDPPGKLGTWGQSQSRKQSRFSSIRNVVCAYRTYIYGMYAYYRSKAVETVAVSKAVVGESRSRIRVKEDLPY